MEKEMEKNKPRILFVEDEQEMIEMYQDKFEREGLDLIGALSVEKGLKMAREQEFDLILLDILLPGENGISFLKKRKKDPKISKIPVVALSNYDYPPTKKEAYQGGIEDYLIKTDFTPDQLVEKIREYL